MVTIERFVIPAFSAGREEVKEMRRLEFQV
jgi:hypothetical protein